MPMVDIGEMGMAVPDGSMRAGVRVIEGAMLMFVRVVFCQMQPDTHGHQRRRNPKLGTGRLAQHQ